MISIFSIVVGLVVSLIVRCILTGIYTVDQNERAVKTIFGRAERLSNATTKSMPSLNRLDPESSDRYEYPMVRVIQPGGPYFKLPWEKIHKVSIATETINVAMDPDSPIANHKGQILDAVTKDQLNIGLRGQLRYKVAEQNLYAYIFGIRNPVAHVLGYFISILRERIANFEPKASIVEPVDGVPASRDTQRVSVNDLRKNLSELNAHMEEDCLPSTLRYGVKLDAVLITEIDPPTEVESALAAINTATNQVSSEVSRSKAAADQRIVQSRRAVEIETLKAQAESQMLDQLAIQLQILKGQGKHILPLYLRNVKLPLFNQVKHIVVQQDERHI